MVEERQGRAITADDEHKVAPADGLDIVLVVHAVWFLGAEIEIDGAVVVVFRFVHAVDRGERLARRVYHAAIGDVVDGHGPEQLCRNVGGQVELVGVAAVEVLAIVIPEPLRVL